MAVCRITDRSVALTLARRRCARNDSATRSSSAMSSMNSDSCFQL
jgi:hypothetical protein